LDLVGPHVAKAIRAGDRRQHVRAALLMDVDGNVGRDPLREDGHEGEDGEHHGAGLPAPIAQQLLEKTRPGHALILRWRSAASERRGSMAATAKSVAMELKVTQSAVKKANPTSHATSCVWTARTVSSPSPAMP